jgi:hypothetical protein
VKPVAGFGSGVLDFMVQVELQYHLPGFQAGKNAVFHGVTDLGIFIVSPDIQKNGKVIGLIGSFRMCCFIRIFDLKQKKF